MSSARRWMRLLVLVSLCVGPGAVSGCGDGDDDFDPADQVLQMRLLVGAQTLVVSLGGGVTNAPIVIGAGETSLSAAFLNPAGNPMGGLDDFELRVTPANTALVRFNRISAFAGTLIEVAPGATQLSVGLWHNGKQHFDFGAYNVPITMR